MPKPTNSYRHLQSEERMTIASLVQQNYTSHGTLSNCSVAQPVPDIISIHVRPPEIEERQLPGHWEGDSFKCEAIASAVGTLVERTSRCVVLVKLPKLNPTSSSNVLQASTDKLVRISKLLRQILTYNQGSEMALHKQLTENTGMAVYFCVLHSLWQRGSNENRNGIFRQYIPKGTDLSGCSQEQLDAFPDEINNGPRKGLPYGRPCRFIENCS